MDAFHSLLRLRRHEASVSQRELADRAGMSVAAVRDLEQGRSRRPHPRSVRALIDALGLTGNEAEELRAAAYIEVPQVMDSGEVRLSVLGPLTVHRGQMETGVGRGKRRVLLGRLALSPGVPVAVDELAELVGSVQVQVHVSRLRSVVPLELVPGGYRLCLPDSRLDLAAFRSLVRSADQETAPESFDLLGRALALWRGQVLADVDELREHPLATALVSERIDALLAYAVGRPAEALPWLRALAEEHPLHEPLHARLIGVLAAADLRADALAVFDRVRRLLADELGVDPGPELVEAHRRLLRAEPPRSVPAQLPLRLARFVAREAELTALTAISGSIAVVSGTAGVGKTTLVVEWAHRVRARFPDGQLHVNLRGFDPVGQPMPALEALHGFLEALGVPAASIPAGLAARSARFRSLLADKRVLIVLDNARDAEHVRPLLPGAPGCQVVVTSRVALTGLVAVEGAVPVTLDVLSTTEADRLLDCRGVSAAARPGIVSVCAGLPLALAIAAARADAVCSGLDTLSDNDPRADVRSVFSWSLGALSAQARRLFSLLGLHPGPDFAAPAAAALAGTDVLPLLDELVEASLVFVSAPGRYAMHDLVREYASELAPDDDLRLLDHYLHTARDAAMLLQPNRGPFSLPEPAAPPVVLSTVRQAWAWFDAERQVLTALSLSSTSDIHVWQLARALASFFNYRGLWDEAIPLHTAALNAGLRMDSLPMQAMAHRHLAGVHAYVDRDDEADHHYDRAITMFASLGDEISEAHARMNFAWLLSRRGKETDALTQYERALHLYRLCGNEYAEARALNAIGEKLAIMGRAAEALPYCTSALAVMEKLGDTQGIAIVLDSLGYTQYRLGAFAVAVELFTRAVPLREEGGDQHSIAELHDRLGDAHSALGNSTAARSSWRRALSILEDVRHQDAADVRAKLDGA
ncbi:tetratricopeptide repeat protein [Lentzea alba]|uniref:BTAD domain-containing putative transcriptional regulator n=1 Tax=Lentzea alba TaxID=2714351 RepID=UPI0039BFFCE9